LRENRKHKRVDARLRCWCEADAVTFYARTANLSEGGLFLRTRTPLDRGTRAVVRLQGQGDLEELSTEAVVVWNRPDPQSGPAGMGLRFESVDSETVGRIRRIMGAELPGGSNSRGP